MTEMRDIERRRACPNSNKIIESLKLLVKIRHPGYRFLTEEMINSYETACLAELVEESSDSE